MSTELFHGSCKRSVSDAACEAIAAGDVARSVAVGNDGSTVEKAHWCGRLKIHSASKGDYLRMESKAKPVAIAIRQRLLSIFRLARLSSK